MKKSPLMLIVLDGWGKGIDYEGNSVVLADTPNFNTLMKTASTTTLEASGISVGLPEGQMGNSEVGHLNIGSGRIIYQELTKIGKSIEDGDFFHIPEFLEAIDQAKENKKKLHLLGLMSDGGVHSHNTHLYGLLSLCKLRGLEEVYVHVFLDGRDVAPTVGKKQVKELEDKMKELGVGKIASVSGRYYSMDRDKRWDRTKLAYDAIVRGLGKMEGQALEAIEKSYKEGINDEFVIPVVIGEDLKPRATIDDGDSVIFYNFRPDRARQLTRAIVDEDFDGFEREKKVRTNFVTMTQYDKTIENVKVAFKPKSPRNTLGEYISSLGLNQLRIAETEKYAHVTFFFNGGREEPYENEDRVLVPSPKVATYDLAPEMSAEEVKNQVIERLNMDKYDLIVLNFANPDMVGHTGVIPAAIKAVETVDRCLGEILEVLKEKNGRALITADHGNAEMLLNYEDGSVVTAHTTNSVPLILFNEDKKLKNGILADLAATVLDLMELEQPEEMTGQSLIIED